jgi:hypothetical protein
MVGRLFLPFTTNGLIAALDAAAIRYFFHCGPREMV